MQTAFSLLKATLTGTATQIPEGIKPVEGFKLDRYLGEWHEQARLEQPFQKGLRSVTAAYHLREDGGINVINKGITAKGEEQTAVGRAYFVKDPEDEVAHLKVSFFGPFFGSYVVFGLDHEDYQFSFVTGSDRTFLWLLTREEKLDPEIKAKFLSAAEEAGFDTSQLIWDEQRHRGRAEETVSLDDVAFAG